MNFSLDRLCCRRLPPCGISNKISNAEVDIERVLETMRALTYSDGDSIEGFSRCPIQDKSAKVVATRWWWVRHAPVRSDGGNIYGQKDIACDTSDREVFEAVAKILPRDAVWYREQPDAHASDRGCDLGRRISKAAAMPQEAAFAEQHLGQWQGMNRAAFLASRPVGSHWFADIDEPAPGGESFMDLYNRVQRRDRAHQRRSRPAGT